MHNDTTKMGKLVDEVKAHEKKERQAELCMASWVQVMQNSIVLNGVCHSGVATHVCTRPAHPGGELCRCDCGVRQIHA